MKNKLYNYNSLYLLIILLVAGNTIAQNSCNFVNINLTQPSEKIDFQCEKIDVLQIELWDFPGGLISLPKDIKYSTVFVVGAPETTQFIKRNGKKMDTLVYQAFYKKIVLDSIDVNHLEIICEFNEHATIRVCENVHLNSIRIRGPKLTKRKAKELIKITGIQELDFENPENQKYISKSVEKFLVSHGIKVNYSLRMNHMI